MATVASHVVVNTQLQTVVALLPGFGNNNFLCDSGEIPVDVRFRRTTKEGLDDDFTLASLPHDFGLVFFGQALIPVDLMVSRWISTASSPYWVAGPAYSKTLADWTAAVEDTMELTVGVTVATVTALDFSALTDISQVPGVLTARTQAEVGTVPDLANAIWFFDSLGRLTWTMATTGSTAEAVTVGSAGIGTELLDHANGIAQAGLDAETPQAALIAVSEIDDDYYNINLRGTSAADVLTPDEAVSLAAWVETKRKLYDAVTFEPGSYDPASTTDTAYRLQELRYLRSMAIYTAHTGDFPDAAINGRCLPAEAGTINFAHTGLAGVLDSGEINPLSASQRQALKDKNCSAVEGIEDAATTILYEGVTAGGIEKRVMIGKDWFDVGVAIDFFNLLNAADFAGFDDQTLAALYNRLDTKAQIAINRRIIADTEERPFVITLPTADEIPDSMIATRKFTELDAYSGYYVSAMNDIAIGGKWRQ